MFNNLNKKQKQIVNTLLDWGINDFIPANVAILLDTKKDRQMLVESNILQVRECEGFAYEFTKEAKKYILNNNLTSI